MKEAAVRPTRSCIALSLVLPGLGAAATAQSIERSSRLDFVFEPAELRLDLGVWSSQEPDGSGGQVGTPGGDGQDSGQSLAKQSQNPIGDLISVPFENTTDFDVGPENGLVNVLSVKPVLPVALSEDLNLVNRFIMPLTYQEERFPGEGSEFGLGDLTYQAFFVPRGGDVMWGVGPAVTVPTHTDDRLGRDQLLLGPAVVVLYKPGRWLVGTLVQNFWDVAGDDDEAHVNLLSWQYFVNYNLDDGWYLTSTPTMTADWNADSDDRWTIPVGGGAGRLVRIGDTPVDMRLQAFWYAEAPDDGPEWAIQFQFKLLFPK
jgi:hypothetical protein